MKKIVANILFLVPVLVLAQDQACSGAQAGKQNITTASCISETQNSKQTDPVILDEAKQFETLAKERLKGLASVTLNARESALYIAGLTCQNCSNVIKLSNYLTKDGHLDLEWLKEKLEQIRLDLDSNYRVLRSWSGVRPEGRDASIPDRYLAIEQSIVGEKGSEITKALRIRDALFLFATLDKDDVSQGVIEGYTDDGADSIARFLDIVQLAKSYKSIITTFPEIVGKPGEYGLLDSIVKAYATYLINHTDFSQQIQLLTGIDIFQGATKVPAAHADFIRTLKIKNLDLFSSILAGSTKEAIPYIKPSQIAYAFGEFKGNVDFLTTYPRLFNENSARFTWTNGLANQITKEIIQATADDKASQKIQEFKALFGSVERLNSIQNQLNSLPIHSEARRNVENRLRSGRISSPAQLQAYIDFVQTESFELHSLKYLSTEKAAEFKRALSAAVVRIEKGADASIFENYKVFDKKLADILKNSSAYPNASYLAGEFLSGSFRILNQNTTKPENITFALDSVARIPDFSISPEIYQDFAFRLLKGGNFLSQDQVQYFHYALTELKNGKFPTLLQQHGFDLLRACAKGDLDMDGLGKILGALAEISEAVKADRISMAEGRLISMQISKNFVELHGNGKFSSLLPAENVRYLLNGFIDRPPKLPEDIYPDLNSTVHSSLLRGRISEKEVRFLADKLLAAGTPENTKFLKLNSKAQRTILNSILSGKMRTIAGSETNSKSPLEIVHFILERATVISGPSSKLKRPLPIIQNNLHTELVNNHGKSIHVSFFSGYITTVRQMEKLFGAYMREELDYFVPDRAFGVLYASQMLTERMKIEIEQ